MDYIKGKRFNKLPKYAGDYVILMTRELCTEGGEMQDGLNVYDEVENIDDDEIGFKVVRSDKSADILRKNVRVGYAYVCSVMVDRDSTVKPTSYGCEANRIHVCMESRVPVSSMSFISNYESVFQEVCKKGFMLQYVHPSLHSTDLYMAAIEQDGISIVFIPPENMCEEFQIEALKQNGLASNFIGYDNMTDEMCGIALKSLFKNVNKPKKNCAISDAMLMA